MFFKTHPPYNFHFIIIFFIICYTLLYLLYNLIFILQTKYGVFWIL